MEITKKKKNIRIKVASVCPGQFRGYKYFLKEDVERAFPLNKIDALEDEAILERCMPYRRVGHIIE